MAHFHIQFVDAQGQVNLCLKLYIGRDIVSERTRKLVAEASVEAIREFIPYGKDRVLVE